MTSRFAYLSTYMQISDGGRSEKLGTLFDIIPLSDLFSILCKNGGARASSTPPSFTGPASTNPRVLKRFLKRVLKRVLTPWTPLATPL